MQTRTILLHGFLGEPADWKAVIGCSSSADQFVIPDLFRNETLMPQNTIEHWPKQFFKWYQELFGDELFNLVGYSMGGRLALEILSQNSKLVKKAILLSTHLGLQSDAEKNDRLKSDNVWAEKFRSLEFAQVLNDWNSQAVLSASQVEPVRTLQSSVRFRLAKSLEVWSLGQQSVFSAQQTLKTELMFAVGERDDKFKKLYLDREINATVLKDAGHRLIFDQPMAVAKIINSFLAN